jgi:chromosome segregation ATPase
MADIVQYLPQVAGGGSILVVGYGLRLFLEWVQQLRSGALEEKKLDMAEEAQHVTDAAAANAIIVSSMHTLQGENARLSGKVERLEQQNAEKDARIERLQVEVSDLRTQVHLLLKKIDGVDFELSDLRDN